MGVLSFMETGWAKPAGALQCNFPRQTQYLRLVDNLEAFGKTGRLFDDRRIEPDL
jgi:hypothetical protein